MNKTANFITLIIIALSCLNPAWARSKAIYGNDDRQDVVFSHEQKVKQWASSVAGKVSDYVLNDEGNYYSFKPISLRDRKSISSSERFADQNTLPKCTGFLIAPGLLMTAGHCVQNNDECKHSVWVFDYDYKAAKNMRIEKRNVATCKRLVTRKYTSFPVKKDYAIIELNWNSQLNQRRPVVLQRSKVTVGTPLAVIGHPLGLPMKITGHAKVLNVKLNTFVNNLDTFAGDSGSPVFNSRTGEVVGIHIQGKQDLVHRDGSIEYSRYDEIDGASEIAQKISSTEAFDYARQ